MRARPSTAVVLGLVLGAALMLGAPSGGCGPVVAPAEGPDGGDEGEAAAPIDLCLRPDAPAACEAGAPEPPDASTATCRGGLPDGLCELAREGCECPDCAQVGRCTGRCVDDGVCRRGGAAGGAGAAGGSGGVGGAAGVSGGSGQAGVSGSSGQSGAAGEAGGGGGAGEGGAAGGAGGAGAAGLDEDCSCDDCDGKVEGCVPVPIGCKTNGVCSALEDDCACADCRDERDCEACVDNGFCSRYTEGCGCADCAALPECQADAGP